MILFSRYGVLLRPDNLSGVDLEVDAFAAVDGSTEPRRVREGDIVLEVEITAEGTRGALWVVHEGTRWQLAPNQPTVGDLVVSICPASDLLYQAGSVLVFAEDGTFVPASFGLLMV
jgi:hypothetical protein